MTKDDLVLGCLVNFREVSGDWLYMLHGDEYIFKNLNTGGFMLLHRYSHNLLRIIDSRDYGITNNSHYDVCRIKYPYRGAWNSYSAETLERVEVEEMTLEQVCKELGRDIKIVKGEK